MLLVCCSLLLKCVVEIYDLNPRYSVNAIYALQGTNGGAGDPYIVVGSPAGTSALVGGLTLHPQRTPFMYVPKNGSETLKCWLFSGPSCMPTDATTVNLSRWHLAGNQMLVLLGKRGLVYGHPGKDGLLHQYYIANVRAEALW